MINSFWLPPLIFFFFSKCLVSGVAAIARVHKQRNGMPGYRGLPQLPGLIKKKHRISGYVGATTLPEAIRPVLLRTMDLPIVDTWFIYPDVRDRG